MSGVWRAVGRNEGAAVIFHSPKACGHVVHDMDLTIQSRAMARKFFEPPQYAAPLVCSNLAQEHSIFGGCDLLRRCIDHTVKTYRPRYIVIVNSCVAGVIGDDSEAVARQAELDWNLPIMAVPCHSFLDGDFYVGFYHAGRVLADRFMESRSRNPELATLLGERGGAHTPDVMEIKRLCGYFGFTRFDLYPAYASLEAIQRVPASSLLIPMGGSPQSYPWMNRLSADLQEMWGIPRIERDYPVGWRSTCSWLTAMGSLLGREAEALHAVKEEGLALEKGLEELTPVLRGKTIVFCIGRSSQMFDPSWVMEMIDLAGLRLDAIVLLDESLSLSQQTALRELLRPLAPDPVLVSGDAGEKISAADFVITTHELTEDMKRQFLLPMQPPAGVRGLLVQLRAMARLVQRMGNRGGIVYG